jgi:hypothetical protein
MSSGADAGASRMCRIYIDSEPVWTETEPREVVASVDKVWHTLAGRDETRT